MKTIATLIASLFAVTVFAADAPKAEVTKAPEVKVEAKKDAPKAAKKDATKSDTKAAPAKKDEATKK
jgi:hypothetical protein